MSEDAKREELSPYAMLAPSLKIQHKIQHVKVS